MKDILLQKVQTTLLMGFVVHIYSASMQTWELKYLEPSTCTTSPKHHVAVQYPTDKLNYASNFSHIVQVVYIAEPTDFDQDLAGDRPNPQTIVLECYGDYLDPSLSHCSSSLPRSLSPCLVAQSLSCSRNQLRSSTSSGSCRKPSLPSLVKAMTMSWSSLALEF